MEELPSKKRWMVGLDLFGSVTINAFWSQNTDLASSNVTPCLAA